MLHSEPRHKAGVTDLIYLTTSGPNRHLRLTPEYPLAFSSG